MGEGVLNLNPLYNILTTSPLQCTFLSTSSISPTSRYRQQRHRDRCRQHRYYIAYVSYVSPLLQIGQHILFICTHVCSNVCLFQHKRVSTDPYFTYCCSIIFVNNISILICGIDPYIHIGRKIVMVNDKGQEPRRCLFGSVIIKFQNL